jgi:hypothetical protein
VTCRFPAVNQVKHGFIVDFEILSTDQAPRPPGGSCSNKSVAACGITPPCIVYVLPDPVGP